MNLQLRHWKTKALLQKLIWTVPGGLKLNAHLSRATAGHLVEVELFQKHAPNFFRQMDKLKEFWQPISDKRSFLEIGTGWDLDIAVLARLTGFGRVVTSDAFPHLDNRQIESALTHFSKLLEEIALHSSLPRDAIVSALDSAQGIPGGAVCEALQLEYVAPVSRNYSEFADESFDVIYSTAVFEHMYAADALETLKQISRMLTSRGFTTNIIDLKDHFAYFQRGLPYNHFLSLSEKQWKFWAGNPMSHTNRLLVSDWERLFAQAGLEIVFLDAVEERNMPSLEKNRMRPEYQSRSQRDLTVGEIHVVARKR
jgi:hypothetical protein